MPPRHADLDFVGVESHGVPLNAAATGAWKNAGGSIFSGSAITNGMPITFDNVEFDANTTAYTLRK